MQIKELKTLIDESSVIYLASHLNPDGDNLGSLFGLYNILKDYGKEVYAIEEDVVSENFHFLPGFDEFVRVSELKESPDLFITLDSADLDRIGLATELFNSAKHTVCIDHHRTNVGYAKLNFINPNSSSTCESVYEIVSAMGLKISADAATCLYTGISTDTGSFKYDSTSVRTFEIAAELLKLGADFAKINIEMYQRKSLAKTRLMIKALSNLEMYEDGKIAICHVDDEMMREVDAKKPDAEGIVENLRDIDGVEIAIFLKIKSDSIRLSIRTKSYADATHIASFFGGGGHTRAAGATMELPYEDRKTEILKLALEALS